MSEAKPYDLAATRTIRINQGAAKHSITVRPPTEPEWFAYFDGVVITAENTDDGVQRTSEAGAAALELVDKIIVSTEGYGEGGQVPIRHRIAVAEALLNVQPVDADETVLQYASEGEVVVLQAGKHDPLVHIFRSPSAEQYRRYMRASSRTLVVGGSRKGKTVYVGSQRVLAALWDELIARFVGYAGTPMDTRHKVVAMERLLAAPSIEAEED